MNVTSGNPQESLMGSLMFVKFRNDLPDVIEGYCKLYAYDSKIIRVLEDESRAKFLQRDIDSVTYRARDWFMKLNSRKFKVMHFGNKYIESDFFIDDLSTEKIINLEVTECERDLGFFVSSYGMMIYTFTLLKV